MSFLKKFFQEKDISMICFQSDELDYFNLVEAFFLIAVFISGNKFFFLKES